MRRALNVVKRIFTVRSCNYDMPREMPERPCLDYHIGRCKAPCILAQSQEDYRAMIDEVLLFLDGRTDEVMRRVQRANGDRSRVSWTSSARRSCAMRCGTSSRWKSRRSCSRWKAATETSSGTRATATTHASRSCAFGGGKLLARDHRFVENIEGEEDTAILSAYLARQYVPLG